LELAAALDRDRPRPGNLDHCSHFDRGVYVEAAKCRLSSSRQDLKASLDEIRGSRRGAYFKPKFSAAIWAMLRPMLIEAVAAGEGALST